MKIQTFVFVIAALTALGCGKEAQDREDYGDLYNGPEGIKLTTSEHRGGYGRQECLLCHNAAYNIHRGSTSNINVDELNRIAREQGSTYCLTCHGDNGTTGSAGGGQP